MRFWQVNSTRPKKRSLKTQATALAFKQRMPEMVIAYEDAAKVIMDNLATDSRLVKKRVGIALAPGIRRRKNISNLTQ